MAQATPWHHESPAHLTKPVMNTAPSKPTITELQANQLVFLAGLKAEKDARAQGVSPQDAETLLNAGCGGKIIGGVLFPPIHAGFMLMLEQAQRHAERCPSLGRQQNSMVLMAYILKNPKEAYQLIRRREEAASELLEETITEFAAEFDLSHLAELSEWLESEMEKLNRHGKEGAEKKLPAA